MGRGGRVNGAVPPFANGLAPCSKMRESNGTGCVAERHEKLFQLLPTQNGAFAVECNVGIDLQFLPRPRLIG